MNRFIKILAIFTFISSLLLFYFQNNYAEIVGKYAFYKFQKNDIVNAKNYAEEAFRNGYHNITLRNKYVDAMLDSSFTIENQEKLYNFLKYDKEDLAKIKVEQAFYKMRRDIFDKYKGNYISQAPLNQKIVRWGEMPITYAYTADENVEVPDYFKDEISNAFMEWERATYQKVSFQEVDKDSNIIIHFLAVNPADEDDKKYVLAYTKPYINGNKLENFKINFYLHDLQGNYFTKNQIYNTALHEIAHALGVMGHSADKRNILYLASDPILMFLDKKDSLMDADIETVNLLYDTKADITNSNEVLGKYISYVVLGGQDDISLAKMREAKNYIKKAPNMPAGYIDLAEAYASQKNYEKAVVLLKRALKYSNTDEMTAIINYNLAIAYFYTGHYEYAKKYLNLASQFKVDESVINLKMMVSKELKDESMMKEIVDANPNNIEYAITLVNYYIEQNEKQKARAVLKKFIQQNPAQKNNPRFNTYGWLSLFL